MLIRERRAIWWLLVCTHFFSASVVLANPSFASLHHALERGDRAAAESGFQRMLVQAEPEVQSLAWAGLAAVAWHRGDADQALDLTAQAVSLDPESVYSHVIRGHVYWGQGKMEAAKSAYRTAADKAHGEPWQYAIAANRLGRIYAMEGFGGTAENYYNRAISQHPERAAFYANKAHLLEALNRPGEALELYRKALRLESNDSLTQVLLQRAEARQESRRAREIRGTPPYDVSAFLPGDDWTSKPLHLSVLYLTQQDIDFPRAGQAEGLAYHLANILQQDPRLTVAASVRVEDAKATASPPPATEISMTHELWAQLRIAGNSQEPPHGARLHVRIGHSEEAQVPADIAWTPETSDRALQQLADRLRQQLRRVYPIRGRIIRLSPRGIRLNIGAAHGVTAGLTMQLLKPNPASQTDQPMGLIKITQVNARDAWAQVVPDTMSRHELWHIQNVQEVIQP